jgi:toxin FitB
MRVWLNEQVPETPYLTSVTLVEMLFGITMHPASRRRTNLARALDGILGLFGDRELTFTADALLHHAGLWRPRSGRRPRISDAGGLHCGDRRLARFPRASRDTSRIEAGGPRVVDPSMVRPET